MACLELRVLKRRDERLARASSQGNLNMGGEGVRRTPGIREKTVSPLSKVGY